MRRDIQNVDDDIARKKRKIEQILYSDPDIIEVLDNPDLDPSCPEEYVHNNIFGFLRIPGTQDVTKNFITFTVDDVELSPNNRVMKSQFVQFVVFVHKDSIDTAYGMYRHDLLAYLIRDIFNWSNLFGLQFKLITNKESTIDSDYYCRTLQFKAEKPNMLNKARMDSPYDKYGRR